MANQTVTTAVNHDSDSVLGLANGENYTINGGSVTVNGDVRWGQNAAVIGDMAISSTLGGSILFDGRDVWEINFDASTGNVPTLGSLGTNGVTGGTSGATGELFRVWAAGEREPRAAGGAMPTSGWIKLRSKTGDFQDNEVITLPGGATVTVNSTTGGKRSWIQVVGERSATITVPRLGSLTAEGDWYYLADTDGTDNQQIPIPINDDIPAVQIETGVGTGVYEWWVNAGQRWSGFNTLGIAQVATDARGKFFGQLIYRTDAATTSGSATVTVGDTTGMTVGMPVAFSTGFSDNDSLYVVSILSGTQITVSANSNATGTGRVIVTPAPYIILARRGTLDCGAKPPSGCRVRVPNVFIGTSNTPFAGQISETIGGDRWDLTTTAAGAITLNYACCCAHFTTASAYSVNIANSCLFQVSHSNTATTVTVSNTAVGLCRSLATSPFNLSNQFTGVDLSDCRGVRYSDGSNTYSWNFTDCANITLTNCRCELFPDAAGLSHSNTTQATIALTRCFDLTATNLDLIGAGILFAQVTRATITDVEYADLHYSNTTTTNGINAFVINNTSSAISIDGFAPFAGLTNVHPYSYILSVTGSAADVELRNIGTAAAPYNCGSANACAGIATLSTCLSVRLRRCYTTNTRTGAMATTNTVQGLALVNVWGDYADSQALAAVNCLAQGCAWTNSVTGQNSVYGRHWEDAFISTTAGRLLIACNEPLPETASQAVATFSPGSGYTSSGSVSMATAADNVVWTMPYFALGHTGFLPSTTVSPFVITGTNISNHKYEYQIDTGSGFSAWKRLVTPVVRSSGGTSGTNTFVMVAKPEDYPQVGDLISSTTAGRLAAGTTVTDVTGNTVTVSSNFLANLGTNEVLHAWRDLQDEPTVTPTTGFKLKIRATVITAAATNALTYITLGTVTNSTDQQIAYPLPQTPATVTARNADTGAAVPGARVLLYAAPGGSLPAEASVSITRSGSTATVTHTGHGLATNNKVVIKGANEGQYNGVFSVTVTDANTYTYTVSGSPATPATGTPNASRVIIDAVTDALGVATGEAPVTGSQPVVGRVRRASSAPYYKTALISATMTTEGLDTTAFLVSDD